MYDGQDRVFSVLVVDGHGNKSALFEPEDTDPFQGIWEVLFG